MPEREVPFTCGSLVAPERAGSPAGRADADSRLVSGMRLSGAEPAHADALTQNAAVKRCHELTRRTGRARSTVTSGEGEESNGRTDKPSAS